MMKKTKLLLTAFVACFTFTADANATWQEGVAAFEAQNYAKAWEEFRPLENSAESKNFMYYMGRMTQLGLGTPKDTSKAVTYYYKAAQQNDSRAAVEIGSIYFSGQDFPPNYPLAKQWFQYAANQGNPVAAYNLGIMYENGVGEPIDLTKAFENFRFAADKGYEEAQRKVGMMMYEGYGTPQDYTTAVKYLIKAANQGNTDSMMTLGDCLSDTERIGAPVSFMHAHKWYNIAAGYGSPEIRKKAIEKRDALVAKMKPEEVLAAHKLARKWKPEKTELILSNAAESKESEAKPQAEEKSSAAENAATAPKTKVSENKPAAEQQKEETYSVPSILGEEDEDSLMSSSLPSF